jgi:hypothetical protein
MVLFLQPFYPLRKFMRNPVIILCTVVLSVIAGKNVFSQEIRNEIRELTTTWNNAIHLGKALPQAGELTSSEKLFKTGLSPAGGNTAADEAALIRARMYRTNPGLYGTASYLENFTPSFNEDDDNLIYQRRLQAGINWEILEGGFYSNRLRSEQIRNDLFIRQQLESGKWKEDDYSLRWNQIIFLFNKSKIKLLLQRQQLVEGLATEAEKLHLARYLTREDYLRILSRKAEIDALLGIYNDYNIQFNPVYDTLSFSAEDLPVPDIKYVEVLAGVSPALRDSMQMLVKRNKEIEHQLLNDVRLSTQLRYNYYDLVIPGNRSFFSLGLNLNFPIPFQLSLRKELAEAEVRETMYKIDQQYKGKEKELLNECYEYRYKLKQYVGFHQKFLLYEELIRKLHATQQIDAVRFNPVEGLMILDDMLAVKMEMMDIRQSLYLKLLRMYVRTNAGTIAQIAEPFTLPNYFDIHAFTSRHTYIWSGILTKKSPAFLSEYLVYNKFDKAYVSVNRDSEHRNRLQQLLPLLKGSGIQSALMIGDNSLIHEPGQYEGKLNALLSGFNDTLIGELHLDLEPHTFDDWSGKQEEYLKKLTEIILLTRKVCDRKKWKLSMAIPLHYPEETVKQWFGIADAIVFMAYENIKPDYIDRKLAPYSGELQKTVVAVRTKDFQSRIAIEKYLIDLFQRSGRDQIAIHDVEGLIMMDEKNLER